MPFTTLDAWVSQKHGARSKSNRDCLGRQTERQRTTVALGMIRVVGAWETKQVENAVRKMKGESLGYEAGYTTSDIFDSLASSPATDERRYYVSNEEVIGAFVS